MTTTEDTPGTAIVLVPGTGEAVDLKGDPPERLAAAADAIAEMRSELNEVEAALKIELVNRLDRTGKWTQRWRQGDVEYEVKAPSPDAGTTSYDTAQLRDRLRAHIQEADIDPDAADAALEQTIVVTFRLSLHEDANPEKLADTIRGAQSIEIAGTPVLVADAQASTKARVAGMNALAKIPACKDTVEAVTKTLPGTLRKATVKPHRKEQRA